MSPGPRLWSQHHFPTERAEPLEDTPRPRPGPAGCQTQLPFMSPEFLFSNASMKSLLYKQVVSVVCEENGTASQTAQNRRADPLPGRRRRGSCPGRFRKMLVLSQAAERGLGGLGPLPSPPSAVYREKPLAWLRVAHELRAGCWPRLRSPRGWTGTASLLSVPRAAVTALRPLPHGPPQGPAHSIAAGFCKARSAKRFFCR